MYEDLRNAPFFDREVIKITYTILTTDSIISVISDQSKRIVENRADFRIINQKTNDGLLFILQGAKNYIPLEATLFFLLDSYKRDKLDEAVEAIDTIVAEELNVNAEYLEKILEKSDEMPMMWAVALYGDTKEKRHSAPASKKSSIDMSKLREFK